MIVKVDVAEEAEVEQGEVEAVSVAEVDAVDVEVSTRPKVRLALLRQQPQLLITPDLISQ